MHTKLLIRAREDKGRDMESAITKVRARKIASTFVLIMSMLFSIYTLNAYALPQDYINSGEQKLYTESIDDALEAHTIFSNAIADHPDDPVINAYLAFTRLLYFAFTSDSGGIPELYEQYGISRTGDNLDILDYQLPLDINDKYNVPGGAPKGETVRAYVHNDILNAVNESINNLDVTIGAWDENSKHIAPVANTNRDLDLEIDYGDIMLFRASLKAFKSLILITCAYDLDIDLREIAALENLEALEINRLLDRYQEFLILLPDSSNMSVDGIALLDQARESLVDAIDDHLIATDKILNDYDLNPDAEELIEIDECDRPLAEWQQTSLTDIRNSLQDPGSTVVDMTNEKDEWIFIDDSSSDQFIADFDFDMSTGDYFAQGNDAFVGWDGEIVCVFIDGDNIDIQLEAYGWPYNEVAFNDATFNPTQTQITGSYDGWSATRGIYSGTFTADLNFSEIKTESINPNPFFGKDSGPYDLRDFLPLFDECDHALENTVGYGLNPSDPDATLGGIFPYYIQSDWGINPEVCTLGGTTIDGNLSIPYHSGEGTIFIQAFQYDGSFNTAPENRLGFQTIYADEFIEGMSYTIDYVTTGINVFVWVWWDLNSNGIFDPGEPQITPPFFTTPAGTYVLDLQIGGSAVPGLDLAYDGIGVYTWTFDPSNPTTALNHWVKVVDHDGVAPDGSSHTVTVTYPGGETYNLWFDSQDESNSAYYFFGDGTIDQPIDPGTYDGTYIYRVTDPDGDFSEASDDLTVDTVGPLDETTFSPGLGTPHSITAFFDNVYVNGSLYDDFESGFNAGLWDYLPPEATYIGGEVRMEDTWFPESDEVNMDMLNPGSVNELQATVRVTDLTGSAKYFMAYIKGEYCIDSTGEVNASLGIRGTEAVYWVYSEYLDGDHTIAKFLVPYTVIPETLTAGNDYQLSIDWDESTATFTFGVVGPGVDFSTGFTVPGSINPTPDPERSIGVECYVSTDTTTPTFNWTTDPNATHYRVRIYGWNDNRIYQGYTTAPPYILPPGIIKPEGIYKYRIYALKDHQWFEWDNVTASDHNSTSIFVDTGAEAQDPYIDLASIGVYTWTHPAPYGANTWFQVVIHDAQGVPGNIDTVIVTLPGGLGDVNLYLDEEESANQGRYRGVFFGDTPVGTYTFTVTDKDTNTFITTEELTPNPIDSPPESSLVPAHNSLIDGTGVSFDWDDVPGAAFYQINLYDQDSNYLGNLKTTDSQYSLPEGLFSENSLFRYNIRTRREFFEDNLDNGSKVPPFANWHSNTFITTPVYGPAAPQLDLDTFGVAVFQGPHPETGTSVYWLEFGAQVDDLDGVPENIKLVEVTYPDGVTKRVLKYDDSPSWGFNYFADEIYTDASLIPSGIYTFRVVDFDDNELTVTDTLPDVVANRLPWATNVSPADGTLLFTTTPTISWDLVPGATYYKVRIMSAWAFPTVHWSGELTDTQYTVPDSILSNGYTYGLRVYAFREDIGNEVDFFSNISTMHVANSRFSIASTLDSDDDGMPDAWENEHGLNPEVNDADDDPDGDGLTNLQEYQNSTDPNDPDSDGDWVNDGDEVNNGTNPNDPNEFTPPGTAAISGTINDSGPNPITADRIQVQAVSGDPCGNWWGQTYSTETNADGTYIIVGLPPGQYYLHSDNMYQSNYVNEWWASGGSVISCGGAGYLDVTAGQLAPDNDFQLDFGVEVSGTVYQSDGITPVTDANIEVSIFKADAPCNQWTWQTTVWSDTADGSFTLKGVPIGDVYLQTHNMNQSNYIDEWWTNGGNAYYCSDAEIFTVPGGGATGVSFKLDLGAQITGTVYESNGTTPITGVSIQVAAIQGDPCGAWQGFRSVHTDDTDGTYTLMGLPTWTFALRTWNDDESNYVNEWWATGGSSLDCNAADFITLDAGGRSGVNFQLDLGAEISGTVYQDDGTTPVTGVEINVEVYQGDPCGNYEHITGGNTNPSSGTYSIKGIPLGTYYLRTHNQNQSNYVDEWWAAAGSSLDCNDAESITLNTGGQTESGINFQLDLGAEISGTVYQSNGTTPVTGVPIRVHVYQGDPCGDSQYMGSSDTDPADGTYTVMGIPLGTYFLQTWNINQSNYLNEWWTASGGSLDCNAADSITLGAGGQSGVNFELDLGAEISGTVYQSDGITPIIGVEINVEVAQGDPCGNQQHVAGVNTNPIDGTYHFRGLPLETYYLRTHNQNQSNYVNEWWASAGSSLDCNDADSIILGAGGQSGVNFHLDLGAEISGTVYQSDGITPVTGVEINVTTIQGDPCGNHQGTVDGHTDPADGTYSIRGVPLGTYFLRTHHRNQSNYLDEWWAAAGGSLDCNAADSITMGAGGQSGVNFELDLGAEISGTVYQDDGITPVTGVEINVEVVQGDPCGNYQHITGENTNPADGTYRFMGVPLGTYYLRTHNQNQSNYVNEWWAAAGSSLDCNDAESITLNTGGQTESGINFQLDLGAEISGTVYQSDGITPVAGVEINVAAIQGDPCGNHQQVQSTNTDPANGTYSIKGVPLGTYFLRTHHMNQSNYRDAYWASGGSVYDCSGAGLLIPDVGGESGINFQLDLGGSISGRITATGGQPIEGLWVHVNDSLCGDGEWFGGAETDVNGDYTIFAIPERDDVYVQTCAHCWGLNYVDEWWDGVDGSTDCNDAAPLSVVAGVDNPGTDITLDGGGSISGRVTTSGGQPIEGLGIEAFSDRCWNNWIGGTDTDANGDYLIQGLPPGDAYIHAFPQGQNYLDEWYDYSEGTRDCNSAMPVTVSVGPPVSNIDFTMEAGFTVEGSVINVHQPGGNFNTYIDVNLGGDFAGNLPDDISSIEVTDPNALVVASYPGNLVFDETGQWNNFFVSLTGQPTRGVYTFTVTSTDATVSVTDYQYVLRTLPIPDTGTFSPASGATITSQTPIFSWDPVDYQSDPDIAIYYRLTINRDDGGVVGEWRVFSTSRAIDLLYYTIPHGILIPGETYWWRVRLTDSNEWLKTQNRANSASIPFTVADPLSPHSYKPAIDLDGWGAVTWPGGIDSGLSTWIKVIDHDGVAGDGSSHMVTVEYPDTSVHDMFFSRPATTTAGYYEMYDSGPVQSGNYTFRVTDLDGNESEAVVEYLDASPLEPPDETSFTPTLQDEYITATFDNVYVNGGLYDTFSYASINDLDLSKWESWFSNLSISGDKLQSTLSGSVGRANGGLSFKRPETIDSIQVDTTVTDVSNANGPPRARISGTWFHNGTTDVWGILSVYGNRVTWSVGDDFIGKQGTSQWNNLASGELISGGGITPGDTITISISWDGADLTFTADSPSTGLVSDTYTPGGTTYPAAVPYKSIQARINMSTGPTPIFTWDPVSGANSYRVRIYNNDNSQTIWRGYTGAQTAKSVPPGVLNPNSYYRFRIEARDAHRALNIDNASKTPSSNNDNFIFYTDSQEAVDPFITFSNHGVHTWTDVYSGGSLSFWIKVHDAQGVPDNIQSVKVIHPGGASEDLDFYGDNPFVPATQTSAIYSASSSLAPVSGGIYTFVVEDNDGHSFQKTEELTALPIGFPSEATLSPANDTDIGSTAVDFDWADVTDAAFYSLDIYDYDYNLVFQFHTQNSEYQLPEGFLKNSTLYRWRVKTRREFFDQNVDNGSSSPGYWNMLTFITTPLTDIDTDQMPDSWEQQIVDADPNDGIVSIADVLAGDDFDGDGLTNLEEYLKGTDPTDSDSDDDNMQDGWEVDNGLNPFVDDSAGDGDDDDFANWQEYLAGTDPNKFDTDGDEYSDGVEVAAGTDPLNPDDFPFKREWNNLGLYGGQIYDIEIDSTDTSRLFAGSYYGDGLFFSSDSGNTWEPVRTGQEGGDLEGVATFRNTAVWAVRIAPGDPNSVWVAHNFGAEKSLNGGVDWTHISNSDMQETCTNCGGATDKMRFCQSLAIAPGNPPGDPQTVYVGTSGPFGSIPNGAIYKTTDDGATWIKTGFDASNNFDNTVVDIAIDPSTSANVWAITTSYGHNDTFTGKLYQSTNSGVSWAEARSDSTTYYDLELWPADPGKVFIATYCGIISNYRGSWETIYGSCDSDSNVRALAFDPQDANVLYAAAHDKASGKTGIVRGEFSAGQFTFGQLSNLELQFITLAVHPTSGDILFGGEVEKGVFKATYISSSDDFDVTEQNEGVNSISTHDIDAISAAGPNPAYLIAATGAGVSVKIGDGDWTPAATEGLPDTRAFAVAFDRTVSDGSAFYAGGQEYLAKTVDRGDSWSIVNSSDIDADMRVSDIAVASNGSTLFVTTRKVGGSAGRVYKSTDSGANLSEVLSSDTFDFNVVVIDPTDSNRILAGGGNYNAPRVEGILYLTTNAGSTWAPTGLTDVIVNALLIDPDNPQVIYAGCGYSGGTLIPLHKSSDGGVSWQPSYAGIPGRPTRYGLWGSGANDVFVLGHTGSVVKGGYDDMKILHYDGSNWSDGMDSGVLDRLRGIWGSGPGDVFAVGNNGAIAHYDGAGWSAMENPEDRTTQRELNAVWGRTGGDVYAAGDGGTILHYDSISWSKETSPTTEHLYGLWGDPSGSLVYAVGSTGTILQYTGTNWVKMASGVKAQLTGVWGLAGGAEVFAVGAPEADSSGDVRYTILRFDGTGWSAMATATVVPGKGKLRAVWGSSGADVFAVGDDGVILHYDGNNWDLMASGSTADLYGVWGLSDSQVYAVGRYGTVLYYDGAQWNKIDMDGGGNPIETMTDWNPVTDLKFKVDAGGNRNVYASTDRQGIYFSPNAADSWINLLSPPYSVFALEVGSIYVASYGVHTFAGIGFICGEVRDELTMIGLDDAKVSTDSGFWVTTNADGIYVLSLVAGNYNLIGDADGYKPETAHAVPSMKDGNVVNYYLTDPVIYVKIDGVEVLASGGVFDAPQGSISPVAGVYGWSDGLSNGHLTVPYPDGWVQLAITPKQDFRIADVMVDGLSQGPLPEYTFANMQGPQTIEAVFEAANGCVCDFDQDGDVDGKDLAGFANGTHTGATLLELAAELGRIDCSPQ